MEIRYDKNFDKEKEYFRINEYICFMGLIIIKILSNYIGNFIINVYVN